MDRMEIMNLKTYRSILEHRSNCKKWGKEFCLECFGGGLTIFLRDIENEKLDAEDNKGGENK